MTRQVVKEFPDGKHGIDAIKEGSTWKYCPYYRRTVGGTSHYYTQNGGWERMSFDSYLQAHNFIARKFGFSVIVHRLAR